MLPATACSWSSLEKSVKKKSHPWNQLPGGAEAALSRVKIRTPNFTTFLNPKGSDGWTFSQTVLLPTVLTSDLISNALKDMYTLMQHVISVSAGKMHLENYTINAGHASQDDHPYGILMLVLKEKFQGKPTNFPHKIIHNIWAQRPGLLQDLKDQAVPNPESAQQKDYQRLVKQSRQWWEILRMFKLSHMVGQNIRIPKTFDDLNQTQKAALLIALREKRSRDAQEMEDEAASRLPSSGTSGATKVSWRPRQRSSSLEFEEDETNDVPSTIKSPRPKRLRIQQGDQALISQIANAQQSVQDDLAKDVPGSFSEPMHDMDKKNAQEAVKSVLNELTAAIDTMEMTEVEPLQCLMNQLLALKGKDQAGTVLSRIADRAKIYTARAIRADAAFSEMQEDAEHETTEEEPCV
ncbi:hypothetical protein RhiJN_25813 [Ceratobasidium sp. AG-Ba]|nr:hypothetical protein RhiJN_25813 [Ceratobasidium sp. AG-Ba]